MEGYGDGSPETIEKFVRSVRSTKVSDEFAEASFEMLPDKFKKSLTGKGKVTGDKYVSDDKAHKDMHFIGYDENGKEMRGDAGAKSRAKLMWKIYLEQGGRDAYTGLPLTCPLWTWSTFVVSITRTVATPARNSGNNVRTIRTSP